MMRNELVSDNTELILNCILLGLYGMALLFGIFRVIVAFIRTKRFLLIFFLVVVITTALQCAIQLYQVIQRTQENLISFPVGIAINVYAMIFQATALFLISDFWGDTSEILTKQSTQADVKEQTHWVRITILSAWGIAFSAFIGYGFGSGQMVKGTFEYDVLILGCQGLGVSLVFVANIVQILQGYSVFSAIRSYQEWVSDLSIHKIQFCCLYMTSSFLNLLRQLFLVAATIVIEIAEDGESQYSWLLVYIYSFSNLPIVVIYFLGFSTQKHSEQQNAVLLDSGRVSAMVAGSGSSSSRRQTQLSRSSRSIQH